MSETDSGQTAIVKKNERFAIKVANEKFDGNIAGIPFEEGVGFTDNPHAAFTCTQFGAISVDRDPPKAKKDN